MSCTRFLLLDSISKQKICTKRSHLATLFVSFFSHLVAKSQCKRCIICVVPFHYIHTSQYTSIDINRVTQNKMPQQRTTTQGAGRSRINNNSHSIAVALKMYVRESEKKIDSEEKEEKNEEECFCICFNSHSEQF